jgi:hypothetical protein
LIIKDTERSFPKKRFQFLKSELIKRIYGGCYHHSMMGLQIPATGESLINGFLGHFVTTGMIK